MSRPIIKLGILGTGFIARSFAMSFVAAPKTLDLAVDVSLEAVASHSDERASAFAKRFNVRKTYTDWKELIADEEVDLVIVATKDYEHYVQAMAVLAAKKHLLCEKPIAMTLSECETMVDVADKSGVKHAVGFTYLANPLMPFTRDLIEQGSLGEIYSFSGFANEDALCDPQTPYTWRCDNKLACYGTSADLGYHFLAQMIYLLGDPIEVAACREIGVPERPNEKGELLPVTTDGMINGVIRYANGVSGSFQASKLCTGRKLYHRIEIHGSKGAVLMDLEDINTVNVYLRENSRRLAGYKRIMAGSAHPPYGYFCPADGHGLGFNDFITIQAAALLDAIHKDDSEVIADLTMGLRVHRVLDSLIRAADSLKWIKVSA